ncbi:LacI family DNA-binding transcriptional regulator [Actinomyces provencensis]|uniref:LacI family DNA-binding transcriptional regulator n=1 Tax=Actinomyces provencensis TaxID=1720198 RepID=UPI00096A6A08|nr:LacI family DNA-binding transcriptional regulator [Actinomyces provencensis]
MTPTTIRDVAQVAGVSIATASRVLTGSRSTSEASRERVLAAADQLHYRVNAHARALRSARSGTAGLLVPDIRNPFFAELAHTVQTELFRHGMSTLIGSASEDGTQQDRHLRDLLEQQIDGVILAPQGGSTPVLEAMAAEGVPMVFVDRVAPGLEVPFVDSDPSPGIQQAVQDLIAVGHQRIAFVAGPLNTSTGHDRLEAFTRIAREHLPPADTPVIHAGYDTEACVAGLEEQLADGIRAFVFGYSPNTLTALPHFRRTGWHVGGDVSVVSFDDIEVFTLVDPRISVISQHVHEMGRLAVGMLDMILAGGVPSSTRLSTTLIRRDSVTAPATSIPPPSSPSSPPVPPAPRVPTPAPIPPPTGAPVPTPACSTPLAPEVAPS